MNCVFCGSEPELIVLIPANIFEGNKLPVACKECALLHGVYCDEHESPHTEFLNDKHACLKCIESETLERADKGRTTYQYFSQSLPKKEFDNLIDQATLASLITQDPIETCLVRFITTEAHLSGKCFETIVLEVINNQSADTILPIHETKS